ncbi:MAG: hypothetical protein ACRD8A_00100 [Candidatus Acidiferrales bacterium]
MRTIRTTATMASDIPAHGRGGPFKSFGYLTNEPADGDLAGGA